MSHNIKGISIPDEVGKMPFSTFKKYYIKVLARFLDEPAEDVYKMLGGELPSVDKPKEKKSKGKKSPE